MDTPKRITVIGPSVGVGLLTVQEGLKRGHTIVAMLRHLPMPDQPNLIKQLGDATNPYAIKMAIDQADALIVAIGTGTNRKATTLYSDAARALVEVFRLTGSTIPVLVVTGFGTADNSRYQPFVVRWLMKLFLGAVYRDKTQMEEIITNSSMQWEIVRPARLLDSPGTGNYRAIVEYRKGMKVEKIARADVAHFLIDQAKNTTLLGKYPALSY